MNTHPRAPRPIPADDAPLSAIVAFFCWADSNGNWPEAIPHTDARIARDALGDPAALVHNDSATISAPINAAHGWYDWEGDYWLTDEECRAQLLPILAEWRGEAQS